MCVLCNLWRIKPTVVVVLFIEQIRKPAAAPKPNAKDRLLGWGTSLTVSEPKRENDEGEEGQEEEELEDDAIIEESEREQCLSVFYVIVFEFGL